MDWKTHRKKILIALLVLLGIVIYKLTRSDGIQQTEAQKQATECVEKAKLDPDPGMRDIRMRACY